MPKSKSKDSDSIGIENLKGFAQKGAKAEPVQNIPTGHFDLDFAIHYGSVPGETDFDELEGFDPKVPLGMPLGKMIEIFGPEGSGKSSLAYRIVGYAQRLGYKALWVDAEQSFSESLASINGVNLDDLYLADKAMSCQDILANINSVVKKGEVQVIVVDSIAGLVPRQQKDASPDDEFMALKARILSATLPDICQEAGANDVLIIFINQVREKLGVMFGDNKTTPGGRVLKHLSSIRLEIIKRTSSKHSLYKGAGVNKTFIGRVAGIKIHKNRFAKPLVNNEGKDIVLDVPVYFEPYFPDIEGIAFDTGRQMQLIRVRKGVFSFNDLKEKGRDNFIATIKEEGVLPELIEAIREEAKNEGIVVPPEILLYEPEEDENVDDDSDENEEKDSSNNEDKEKKKSKSSS